MSTTTYNIPDIYVRLNTMTSGQ